MQISGKPIVTIPKPLLDPLSLKHLTKDWLVGFTDAEGCFFVHYRVNSNKTGHSTGLGFTITQHSRDSLLFQLIK
jgi:hypothetical protein